MIARLDEALFRAERVAVAVILVVMGTVVFFDVVHRVSTRAGSVFASPVLLAWAAVGIAFLAMGTRRKPRWWAIPIGLGIVAAQQAFVRLVPSGLFWSQALALALTLWLGFLGASLAAHDRRHLALDVGSKVWPAAIAPKMVAVGHVITASFCVLLAWHAGVSVVDHATRWAQSDYIAATMAGTQIPRWIAAAAVPYGMAALTFRFLYEAVRTWRGEIAVGGDDTLHQLGIDEATS